MAAVKALTMFFPERHVDANRWLRPGLMSSDSVEAYTPVHIREAVVEVLGRVDVDPCSDPGRTFPAARHFTKEDNGLARHWIGNVYMNPPYGRGIRSWTTKLLDELDHHCTTAAIALLPARVDARWWQELRPESVCMLRGRLHFEQHEGAAPFPSVAVYFGEHPADFARVFRPLGLMYASLDSGH